MLFGDQQYAELPEYAIQILIDRGVGVAQWEDIGRQMQQANLHRNRNTFYANLKKYGLPTAAMASLFHLANRVNPMRPIKPTAGMRGTIILQNALERNDTLEQG